jgi:hypothetical protein
MCLLNWFIDAGAGGVLLNIFYVTLFSTATEDTSPSKGIKYNSSPQ